MSFVELSDAAGKPEPATRIGEFQASSRGRMIFWNFSSLSASAAVSRLAALATNVVLARRVSTSGYGITGIAQSTTMYFGLLSDLGLGTVAIREGVQRPG